MDVKCKPSIKMWQTQLIGSTFDTLVTISFYFQAITNCIDLNPINQLNMKI